MNPLISVILPTYNRAGLLKRALSSIISQTYPHWEVLVVDNNSTDNTDQIVHDFNNERIRLLKVDNHGVIALSRNVGIREARGEYIAFLDSDDWWKSNKLEKSLAYLENGKDVVYHDLFVVAKRNQRVLWRKARTRTLKIPIFKDLITNGNALNNSSVVLRKKILEDIGGLSEDRSLVSIEDYDAWLRASLATLSPDSSTVDISARFAWYPDENNVAGRPWSRLSWSSSARCAARSPLINRLAPAPAPSYAAPTSG